MDRPILQAQGKLGRLPPRILFRLLMMLSSRRFLMGLFQALC